MDVVLLRILFVALVSAVCFFLNPSAFPVPSPRVVVR